MRCRAPRGTGRVIAAANAATERHTGVNLVQELGAEDALEQKQSASEISTDSVECFWQAWTEEDIGDVPCGPCRSQDIYDLYRLWAGREGVQMYASKQIMLTLVGKKPGVVKRQERYTSRHGAEQSMLVFPPGAERHPPRGTSKADWLGKQVGAFADAVAAWGMDS